MKKAAFAVAAILVLSGIAAADPALGAGRGLFRVQDARAEEDGALVFANRWMFRDTALQDGKKYGRGPLFGMEMGYSPYPFIELNGSVLGVAQFRPWDFQYDWQGFGLGGKLSYPYLPVVKVAVSGNWFIHANDHSMFPGFLDDMFATNNYWRAILAFRFWDLHKTLPTLTFNYGTTFDSSPTRLLGLGLELPSNALDYFVEVVSETKATDAAIGDFWTSPTQATIAPGVRIKFPYFHLNGGIIFGLKKPWTNTAVAGFTIVSPFPRQPPKPAGQFAGRVEDALTGQPLAARIKYLNRGGGELKTDPKNGTFYTAKSPVGALLVEASADGYRAEATPVAVRDQGVATYVFKLRRMVATGTLFGRVYDLATTRPLAAKVTVDLPNVAAGNSLEKNGFYRMDSLPIGLATVTIERNGYVPDEHVVEIEEAKATKLEVGLKPIALTGTFKGSVLDAATGAGLGAVITFTGSKQPDLPTNPTSGGFQVELEPGTYNVRVTAQNYQPQTAQITVAKGGVLEQDYRLSAAAAVPKVDTSKKLVQPTSPGAFMTLQGVLFDFNVSDLRPDASPALMQAAEVLKQYPDIKVEVQGHTDSVGGDDYNMNLSIRRAQSVADFLVTQGGIDRGRLVVKGYGKTMPVATNETDDGRQLNRRVDFVIIK